MQNVIYYTIEMRSMADSVPNMLNVLDGLQAIELEVVGPNEGQSAASQTVMQFAWSRLELVSDIAFIRKLTASLQV
jgi:hypothetical protein